MLESNRVWSKTETLTKTMASNNSLGKYHVLFSEQMYFHVLLSLCLTQGTQTGRQNVVGFQKAKYLGCALVASATI